MRKFIALLIVIGIIAGFSEHSFAASAPRQCLEEINAAIAGADSAKFEELVAVDAILEQALDVFLAEAAKPESASKLPPMLALMLSQAAGQDAIRKLLLSEARAFVINGVASGAFAGKKIESAQRQGLLAPLFAHASIGRKEIRNIGEPLADGEGGWFVPFTVRDFGNGNDYAVIGRISPATGGLRLANVENLEQIFTQIGREAQESSQELSSDSF